MPLLYFPDAQITMKGTDVPHTLKAGDRVSFIMDGRYWVRKTPYSFQTHVDVFRGDTGVITQSDPTMTVMVSVKGIQPDLECQPCDLVLYEPDADPRCSAVEYPDGSKGVLINMPECTTELSIDDALALANALYRALRETR